MGWGIFHMSLAIKITAINEYILIEMKLKNKAAFLISWKVYISEEEDLASLDSV